MSLLKNYRVYLLTAVAYSGSLLFGMYALGNRNTLFELTPDDY